MLNVSRYDPSAKKQAEGDFLWLTNALEIV